MDCHRVSLFAAICAAVFAGAAFGAFVGRPANAGLPVVPAVADGGLGAAVMHASVAANGTLIRGSGAVAVEKVGPGYFQVSFNRSIASCSYFGSVGRYGTSGTVSPTHVSAGRAIDIDTVVVLIQTPDSGFVDNPFHLLVVCSS
jgi:hypothetical protein